MGADWVTGIETLTVSMPPPLPTGSVGVSLEQLSAMIEVAENMTIVMRRLVVEFMAFSDG
jgi:hypothetical protein